MLKLNSLARRQKTLLVIAIVSIAIFILWITLTGQLWHYPNSKSFTDNCGGNFLNLQKSWWQVTFTYCFVSVDKSDKIRTWYAAKGWFVTGERLIFPGWQVGQTYLEFGKQFHTTDLLDNKTLIVQEIIYRAGPCVVNCK